VGERHTEGPSTIHRVHHYPDHWSCFPGDLCVSNRHDLPRLAHHSLGHFSGSADTHHETENEDVEYSRT